MIEKFDKLSKCVHRINKKDNIKIKLILKKRWEKMVLKKTLLILAES